MAGPTPPTRSYPASARWSPSSQPVAKCDPAIPKLRLLLFAGPWFPGGQAVLYANQYQSTDIVTIMNDQPQPEFVGPSQAGYQWNQENAGYAPPYEAGGPIQVQTDIGPDQTQVIGLSVTESLRRLAGSYVNSPESLVNTVRLELGPSGRFQVVITVEITDIL
ncbi:hypothetical protein BJV74DRAFT_889459 [Russula compacta]|nr:hypothetical protein BJV74DRAFT_889459 [Russula compacta]